jgi:hypothetical protein
MKPRIPVLPPNFHISKHIAGWVLYGPDTYRTGKLLYMSYGLCDTEEEIVDLKTSLEMLMGRFPH